MEHNQVSQWFQESFQMAASGEVVEWRNKMEVPKLLKVWTYSSQC